MADEYALLVTFVEEARLLKEAAAPYTKYVGAHFTRLSDKGTYLFLTLLGREGIAGDPVTAAAEDLLAIDNYLEAEEVIVYCSLACHLGGDGVLSLVVIFTADLVDVVDNSDGSDAHLGAVVGGVGACREGIERLLAVAGGIPELRLRYIHLSDHKLTVGIESVAIDGLAARGYENSLDDAGLIKAG